MASGQILTLKKSSPERGRFRPSNPRQIISGANAMSKMSTCPAARCPSSRWEQKTYFNGGVGFRSRCFTRGKCGYGPFLLLHSIMDSLGVETRVLVGAAPSWAASAAPTCGTLRQSLASSAGNGPARRASEEPAKKHPLCTL